MTAVLDIRNMTVALGPPGRRVTVVDGVSLRVEAGQVLCVVGESGSGKSVSALALMRLLPAGRFAVTADRIGFEGQDLRALPEPAMARLRGDRMAMVFQEPMTSLNPLFTVGDQIGEVLQLHRGASRAAARAAALRALQAVQMPAPERRLDAYPHELSGGLRQRVMIAMALACDPALLIADEPTTALDVTIQAQVLALLAELRRRTGTAILFITHNLGVVAEIADAVAVMYAGQVVERAPAATLFTDAQHPYTLALLAAMPSLSGGAGRLEPIPGRMPAPGTAPAGCRFAPRCPFAAAICAEPPPLRAMGPGHDVACWRAPVETLQ
ncbi:MAG: ABC transporter ATP-binding protein [Janthinobacterium lividum]